MGTIVAELLFIIAIVALGKYILSRRAHIRGALGESRVRQQLEKVKLENYKVLNDIMVKTEKGTSQIDHVAISPYGLLVIETKNYRGWIYGSEESEYWTQVLNRNSKQKFRNPIRQNWGHICALKEVLHEYNEIPYHSIIVLAGSAEFKTMHDVRTKIVYPDMLYETVLAHRGIEVLNESDIDMIYNRLTELSLDDEESRKQHIEQVKKAADEKQANMSMKRCPWCDRPLVKRTGKFGDFYGCTRFPKCKYTLKITANS